MIDLILHYLTFYWLEKWKNNPVFKIYCVINLPSYHPSHAFVLSSVTCFHLSVGCLDGNSSRCGTSTRITTNSRRYAIPGRTHCLAGHWVPVVLRIWSINPLFEYLCMFYDSWSTSAHGNGVCLTTAGLTPRCLLIGWTHISSYTNQS